MTHNRVTYVPPEWSDLVPARDHLAHRLLVHLASMADREGIAFQRIEGIEEALGVTRSTLYRAANRLESYGVAYRVAGGHKGRVTRWLIAHYVSRKAAEYARGVSARLASRRSYSGLGAILKRMTAEARASRQAHQAGLKGRTRAPRNILTGNSSEAHPDRIAQLRALEALMTPQELAGLRA